MKTSTRRMAVLVTAAALGVGVLAVAAPALAGSSPFGAPPAPTAGPGPAWTGGNGMGPRGAGSGPGVATGTRARHGSCADLPAQGTLTEPQQVTLVAMAQEEKLARDLYAAFADRYPAVVFDRIAAAEAQHLTAVRTLLTRYGLADPTAGRSAGQFSDPAVQATYTRLLTQGQASQTAALQVGQTVERTDIADLQAALNGLTAPDVEQVYNNLLAASQHHLTAFSRWTGR